MHVTCILPPLLHPVLLQDLILGLARKVEKMDNILLKVMDILKSLSSSSSSTEQPSIKRELESSEYTVSITLSLFKYFFKCILMRVILIHR